MKYIIFVLSLFISFFPATAQEKVEYMAEYFMSFNDTLPKFSISYSLHTQDRKTLFIFCYLEDNKQVVVVGRNGLFEKELLLVSPSLFDTAYHNIANLKQLRKKVKHFKTRSHHRYERFWKKSGYDLETVTIKYTEGFLYRYLFPKPGQQRRHEKELRIQSAYRVIDIFKTALLKAAQTNG